MTDLLHKTLNLIDDIINKSDVKSVDFYSDLLLMMSSLYEKSSLAIFFLENTDYTLKKAIKNSNFTDCSLKEKRIEDFLESDDEITEFTTKPDDFFSKYTLAIKLKIRESVFGFMLLSLNSKPDDSVKASFRAAVNIISYKIKDYELNDVFKLQLKALQDAIIEKENAYEIIKTQHKKLKELDKAKSLFLANISHELRTPLNAIIGFSQALDSEIFGSLNEKQKEYINDIQISGLHLLGMINEILDLSKFEANAMKFSPSEISPHQSINEVIGILEPLYKNKNISVEFISKYDGKILADYQKFQQILYNLLSNAIKFTPENGKIEIYSNKDKKDYILKIKDNGIGIDKKFHNKIFKKFIHLDNIYTKNQSSTGLGLTITKELVKLHKGKITLESEVNKGTTFIMQFKDILV